jgi:hypothetical protein
VRPPPPSDQPPCPLDELCPVTRPPTRDVCRMKRTASEGSLFKAGDFSSSAAPEPAEPVGTYPSAAGPVVQSVNAFEPLWDHQHRFPGMESLAVGGGAKAVNLLHD